VPAFSYPTDLAQLYWPHFPFSCEAPTSSGAMGILRSLSGYAAEWSNRVRRDERLCPWLSGNNLKFDVMRIDDELLDINLIISESFSASCRAL